MASTCPDVNPGKPLPTDQKVPIVLPYLYTMNTRYIIGVCASCLFTATVCAQVSQKGKVRIYNSQNTPLAGVQLIANGAPATDSDSDGNFSLDFTENQPGTAISSPHIYKKGYEVVNKDVIDGWILSEKRPMDIVMAVKGTVEEQKNRYYAIAVDHFTKLRNRTVKEINDMYNRQKITAAERSLRLQKLAEENSAFMKRLDEYAEKFARINPDDVNTIEKQVLELVNNGKLTEAVELYNSSGLISQAREKLQQRQQADEDIESLVERMYRYADLCTLAGGKENEQKSYDVYQWIAQILPDRFSYVLNFAMLKISRAETDASAWLERCQKLAYDEKSLVQVMSLKTVMAQTIQRDYSKAMEYNIQALEILQHAQNAMPSGDYMAVLHHTFFISATIQEAVHNWEYAEDIYLDEIETIQKEIAASDNPLFIDIQKGFLMDNYTALMKLYAKTEETEKASATYSALKAFIAANRDMTEQDISSVEMEYLDMQLEQALNAGNLTEAFQFAREAYQKAEKIYQQKPLTNAAAFLHRYTIYLQTSIDSESDRFPERAELLRKKIEQEFTSLPHDLTVQGLLNLEIMYATYYSYTGNRPQERECIEKAYRYAKQLNEVNAPRYIEDILYAQAKYIDLLLETSRTQQARQAALELDALYVMQTVWGYRSLVVENSIGTVFVCSDLIEPGLEYLEKVKDAREKELEKYPDNTEMKISICTTYNTLSMGYSKLKKYRQALKEQKKAYLLMKELYPTNKLQLGTNYMLMTLNTSVNYYQNGDNALALQYLDEAAAIADELKALHTVFSTYPLLIKLAKGDLLDKLSQPDAQALLKEALDYKAGSLPNDALLLYSLKEYHQKGLYNK